MMAEERTHEAQAWQLAVRANLQQARKTNGRLGTKKNRTGCVTCKNRRVRCDEAKPACTRCTSAGRVCDGYSGISQRATTPLGTVSITSTLGLRPDEMQTFDYFISTSGPRLAGSLDKDFWCGQLLQLCHAERFVLDAVLAISTLYQHPQYLQRFSVNLEGDREMPKFERMKALQTGDPFGNHRVDQHHASALRLYNHSIATLKARLAGGDVSPTLVLLSSMLYIAIEIIRDNVFVALGLFSQSISLMPKAVGRAREDSLTAVLRIMLARVAVTAATFGHTEAMSAPSAFAGAGDSETFASITDARTSLSAIMAESHTFIKRVADYDALVEYDRVEHPGLGEQTHTDTVRYGQLSDFGHDIDSDCATDRNSSAEVYTDSQGPAHLSLRTRLVMPHTYTTDWLKSTRSQEQHFMDRLDRWRRTFDEMQTRSESKQPDAVSHLLLYYHVTRIWLSTRLVIDQTGFDDYTHDFEQIIRHAEVYILANADSHFTFEVGAIPPLYMTATKCRVPSLRRKALQLLLKAPQKESIWGAATTAQLAATLMEFEEEGLGLPSPCDSLDVPVPPELATTLPTEEMRVHHLWLLKNNDLLRFDVKVLRYVMDGVGGWRKVEQIIPIKPCTFGRRGAFA